MCVRCKENIVNIPNLADPIRNYAYEWILQRIEKPPLSLLDIGCRDVGFPSYMAHTGYNVTTIDREDFSREQGDWKNRFNCNFSYITKDILDIDGKFDIITAVYSLQHNIEKDIECYKKCASLAKKQIFIINEFNCNSTKYDMGRNDGDMRIYSEKDVIGRIVAPMYSMNNTIDIDFDYAKFVFVNQSISKSKKEEANTILIKISI